MAEFDLGKQFPLLDMVGLENRLMRDRVTRGHTFPFRDRDNSLREVAEAVGLIEIE
jgi:hypothetical protein